MTLPHPILLVHGIWNGAWSFRKLGAALERAGAPYVYAPSMRPNNGSAPLEELARQVDEAAQHVMQATGAEQIDVIGFSMGALVSRVWLQRFEGRVKTRRYISISGPHSGTLTAWLVNRRGVQQMRPRSELLAELDADPAALGEVDVHVFYTPHDIVIYPPQSAELPGATSTRRFDVRHHRQMIRDRRVLEALVETLRG